MMKPGMKAGGPPAKCGLYDPAREHDACGVGFVADITGRKSSRIVSDGLEILNNMRHRGAVGADPAAGDGAGILLQLPRKFLREETDFDLPPDGEYAAGMVFFPRARGGLRGAKDAVEKFVRAEGQRLLGWRRVPVNNAGLGDGVRATEPDIRQVFIARGANCAAPGAFERKLFLIRKQIENAVRASSIAGREAFYIPSLSSRALVYKGMLRAAQLREYYPDLADARMESALALVHQRFSTNTFPAWGLAHPYRLIAHNGEINTLRGNLNWMAARRGAMKSKLLGAGLKKIWPLIHGGQSDSASLDAALELLLAGGYSLAHAVMMLIPEAWEGNPDMPDARRAFYEYHAALMEPWDGPAAVAFTDGRQIGAVLDRNGLRPARCMLTRDRRVVMASEAGVLGVAEADIVRKWRLQPGKMLLVDLEEGRIIGDDEIKDQLAAARGYRRRLNKTRIALNELRIKADAPPKMPAEKLRRAQRAFGCTREDLQFVLLPMLAGGAEAVGSMGSDVPPPALSMRGKHLSAYFKQNFAQVTNPPIDPIREQLVMSLMTLPGPRPNLLGGDDDGMRLCAPHPVLRDNELEFIRRIGEHSGGALSAETIDICYPARDGAGGMGAAVERVRARAERAVRRGKNILILSDRRMDARRAAIPALLATSAVHHHLIRKGLRTRAGLVVETGACMEVHHAATLAGYGAEAINPYLAFASIAALLPHLDCNYREAQARYIAALCAGLKKVMSKMGISTYQSYCGAQIFDAVGLSGEFVENYFTATATAVEGAGLAEISEEAFGWHRAAHGNDGGRLDVGGDYAYRVRGEAHAWNPETVAALQHAVRGNDAAQYAKFAEAVDRQDKNLYNLRGLFKFKWSRAPLPLDEVEPASELVRRFSTGAMSFGSISHEAHSNLARAMNQIGGKSNTGEGGEDASRYRPLADGSPNPARSAIKQVASGRFGVTAEYLVNADELQIKMAQGAKPGEGGQIPGHKVADEIARVRHSTPGVGLISPPPHHDIYSIEDLAQLIFDLKNVNPAARISVKLVSETGVGTVAAGVAKARADHVTISGHEGGTGASPLTSIRHAGSPWEIGLAETQQTLVLNGLRGRIAVQVDGGIRTGRDVAIGALLGADEFGFATAPLIASGCVMMRKCHLNTCPVGVATQDPRLRAKFTGRPEHVVNYFFFVAEQLRGIMAKLGFRTLDEMIGRADRLNMRRALAHWKARNLDYARIFAMPKVPRKTPRRRCEQQEHGLARVPDRELIARAQPALLRGEKTRMEIAVTNADRAVGAMLSGRIAEKHGDAGLADDAIHIRARGSAGQSFGAWLARGVTIALEGETNDYAGKGLSGGRLIIRPPRDSGIGDARDNIIAGNTVLYGATAGEFFCRGAAGERFAVRNSGAVAVIEGVGDHGCEYMTGGVVVCLGATGRNFAAGMSGGVAYVLDADGNFASRCNRESVELEKIAPAGKHEHENAAADLDDLRGADEARLQNLLKLHLRHTGSSAAENALADWRGHLGKFVKVMPVDYRRALQERAQAAAARRAEVGEARHG
ncbi:MAG: glutamate synthase large subunit [Gammaproteobacteria bacterium]|nr:glutamate synthase large subunit [Gammaproteobacteria bacterium]